MQCTFSEPWDDGVSYRQCVRDAVCLGRCREHANPFALDALAAMTEAYDCLILQDNLTRTRRESKAIIQLRQAIARMRGLT